MNWLACLLGIACAAGCAGEPWRRAGPAALLPALALRLDYRRLRDLRTIDARDQVDVTLSASLRWHPRNAAAAIPSQAEQAPSVWLAPCALDDLLCLAEVAEAEPEIADALRETPQ